MSNLLYVVLAILLLPIFIIVKIVIKAILRDIAIWRINRKREKEGKEPLLID